MTHTAEFLVNHGLPLVLAAVLVEQMGLPLPAFPWLLAAGALVAAGKFSFAAGLALVVIACLLADSFWFYLGKNRGNQVLRLLCRISLEPDSCVRRTQNVFTKYGLRSVVINKFLPGISTIVPPLAGMTGVRLDVFLGLDTIASLLYGGVLLSLGFLFSRQIEKVVAAIQQIGGSALDLLLAALAIYIAYKFWQRQRLLRELRMARITVNELRQKLDAGQPVLILDVRPKPVLEQDGAMIPGAIHLELDQVEHSTGNIPNDRDIVVYCACPNEVSAARVALRLQRHGFTHVRPLFGGIDAWRQHNYPLAESSRVAESKTRHAEKASLRE